MNDLYKIENKKMNPIIQLVAKNRQMLQSFGLVFFDKSEK